MPARLAWFVTLPPTLPAEVIGRCNAVLDEDERRQAAAFRIEPARQQFVVAHAVVRTLLSTLAEVPPTAWRFGRGEHGKPFIASPAEGATLAFSLSHTPGLVAVAVSADGDIGVDVETTDRPIDVEHFRSCLSPNESTALLAESAEALGPQFAELWTAKEAVAKAVGTGISAAMAGIEITPVDGVVVSRSPDARYDGWHIIRPAVPGGHRAAIATRRPQPVAAVVRTIDQWLVDVGL